MAAVCALLIGISGLALGQTSDTVKPAEKSSESSSGDNEPSPSVLDELPPAVIYLLNKDGQPVAVPRGAKLEEWLNYLKQSREKPKSIPAPAVATLELTGTVDDERAVLTGRFVIQNFAGQEFVPISLGLQEAVLRDWSYEGPGELQFKPGDRAQGYTWWLRGSGKHIVTLEFSVPVKKQAASRRLQLSLPDATVSRLKLTTNHRGISAKSFSGEIQVINTADQPSRIELLGLGPRLDLNWQPNVAESPAAPLLEAETSILVHASSDKLLLEAFQRLHVVQGSISEVAVRLPPNAELLSVEGRDYRSHRVSAEEQGRVLVQLLAPATGQIQLKWTLRLSPAEQRRFVLEGFSVEQARKQSGQIGLVPVEGLRLSISNADHPHLLRINAAELRPLSEQVARAYRFFSQPFRMVLGVERIEPYFTVEPRLTLTVSLDEMTLDGLFSLQILRGNLRSVDLNWPNWKADGWVLDTIEPQGDLITGVESEVDAAPERLRLRLTDDHADQFTLRLKARRPIRGGESVPVSLPQMIASDVSPTTLHIVEAENITCDVAPIGETILDLQAAEGEGSSDATVSSAEKTRRYRIPSGEQLLSLRPVRRERRVEVTSVTTLQLANSRLRGQQKLQFDVQHERLSQARLSVPKLWRDRDLRFVVEADRSLPVAWSAGQTAGWAVAQVTFPEPRLGRFPLEIQFEIPLTEAMSAGDDIIEVPIFDVLDSPVRRFEVLNPTTSDSGVTVADADWKLRSDASAPARWSADGPLSSVRVRVEAGGVAAHQYLISQAELTAEWDRQGAARCVASYRLSGGVSRLQLNLPPDASLLQVLWDKRRLMDSIDVLSEGRPGQYLIKLGATDADRGEHRLTIDYQVPAKQVCGLWNQWTFAAPQLPQARWAAQGYWQIRFPRDQHLFSYAASVTPLFQWQRNGVIWGRVSPELSSTATGATERLVPQARESAAIENTYAFRQFGELREFHFSTMSGPMILLIGASVSLLVSFLVLNMPALRSLMTVWGGIFAIALAGLWYRPQLEVLLQPVVVGLLFPLIAIWVQNLRRTEVPPVLSFDPLMDLAEPRSSSTRLRFPGDGLDQEPVLARTPTGSTHDFLRSEAGSGVS